MVGQGWSRRTFIQRMGQSIGLAAISSLPLPNRNELQEVIILHTNDVHSRIEPFPESAGELAGKGGAARRAAYIESVRQQNEHVLLLDSGDIWQGTPYFNVFKGGLEFELMSQMKYDASTLGNHDFDLGIEGLKAQWSKAQFPFICTNYDFSETPLSGKTLPYHIISKGALKFGILGAGIELEGLVPDNLYGKTNYLDPVDPINRMASFLKKEQDCDYVILLSHLGLSHPDPSKISDRNLVPQTEDIDLVLGGHSHTFLEEVEVVQNRKGHPVPINQVGFGGAMIGHLHLTFDVSRKKKRLHCQNCWL